MILKSDYNRLLAVNRYKELLFPHSELNNIVALASEVCEASVAVISLIDDVEEKFIATKGTDKESTLLDKSFCIENLLHDSLLTVSDVANHKKFSSADLSMINPAMRFYAAGTLISPQGYVVGRLYVLDQRPKQLTKSQESCLQLLATQVIQCLEQESMLHNSQKQLSKKSKQDVAIPESEILLHAFFHTGEDYHILLNSKFEIVAHNRCAASFTLQYNNQVLENGQNMLTYISPLFTAEFKRMCNIALKGEKIEYEHFINGKSSEHTWYNFILNPTYNSSNEIIGLSLSGSNINRQKKQEKTIKHQSDTLSVIAQLQSHQVRQPVASILGLMSLIKEENYVPQKEYLIGLERATHQLDEVIQTIVSQSRSI